MFYFAVIDPELPIVLGIFASMLVGFYTIAKVMLNQATKEREADREERIKFAEAVENMAKSSGKVADTNRLIAQAVTRQSDESAERNGHLAELIIKQGEQTQMIADKSVDKITTHIKKQTVDEQTVKHQTVAKSGKLKEDK